MLAVLLLLQSWTMTGPLPQVLFLLGAFFSCIPLANAIAAVVRVREGKDFLRFQCMHSSIPLI